MKSARAILLVAVILVSLIHPVVFGAQTAHADTLYSFRTHFTTAYSNLTVYWIPIIADETWDITLEYSVDMTCNEGFIELRIEEAATFRTWFNSPGHYEGTVHYTYQIPTSGATGPALRPRCPGHLLEPEIYYMEMTTTLTIRVFTPSDEPPVNIDPALPIDIGMPLPEQTANGEQYLDIWQLDENGIGQSALYVSAEDINALPEFLHENTLISSTEDGFISVYKLVTGEFQINIGPLSDGKIHVIIFDQIPPTHQYGYTIPN